MDNQAKNVLKDESVETKYIETNKNQNGFGVVINYQEERTILSYYPDALCCFPEDQELETDWVYFTSMGMNYEIFTNRPSIGQLPTKPKLPLIPEPGK